MDPSPLEYPYFPGGRSTHGLIPALEAHVSRVFIERGRRDAGEAVSRIL